MGNNTIDKLMPRICEAAKTSRRYTNHCVRHTLGTNMLRLGYALAAIQARLRLRSALTLQWYTGHRTAQELTEEMRAVSGPLRGIAPPRAGAGDGAVAGPSSARQFVAPPQRAPPREVQRPRQEQQADARAAPAATVCPVQQPQLEQRAAPRPANVAPLNLGDLGFAPFHDADMTRPPPPLPAWVRLGAAHPPKIYSGVFHNCTFN